MEKTLPKRPAAPRIVRTQLFIDNAWMDPVEGGHFDTLGARLKSSLEAYNQAVGSLEGNVLVKARRFKELQATNGVEEIKVLEPIDRVQRMLQARELTDGLPFAEAIEEEDAERV